MYRRCTVGYEGRAASNLGDGDRLLVLEPDELDREVADIKLAAEGVEYDTLTDEQREYMGSWEHGI